ncbi:hypothetical protein B0T11DRAFT_233594, partial [Plectosphaerella cucumerina]
EPFKDEASFGAFRPDGNGSHSHLVEASEKLHIICHLASDVQATLVRCGFQEATLDAALARDRQQLKRLIGVNKDLTRQLAQAKAGEAYYRRLLAATTRTAGDCTERSRKLPTLHEEAPGGGTHGMKACWPGPARSLPRSDYNNAAKLRVLAEETLKMARR